MIRLKHAFVNQNLTEYNDNVFDVTAFNVDNKKYLIKLTPNSNTLFWRFGIVFSKTREFDFQPGSGRYNNQNLKFIQVNVGDFKNGKWIKSSKLEIQTYYFSEYESPLYTLPNYIPGALVQVELQYDAIKDVLSFSVTTNNFAYRDHPFSIEDFKFFKIFSWADTIPFGLEAEIDIQRTTPFKFPTIRLSDNEKKYLDLIYRLFLENKQVDRAYDLKDFWNNFPPDFDPNKINRLLLQSDRFITLWGIWNIHPESDIFIKFDDVVLSIKYIFQMGIQKPEIDSLQIAEMVPGLTQQEILKIFDLMSLFRNFHRGRGTKADGTSHINIHDEDALQLYRNYQSLQEFLNEFLFANGLDSIKIEQPTAISKPGVGLDKTKFLRRSADDFSPVLGVINLANDLANIIYDLPKEKGQMIGIFGKWGRGKTFLLNELDKVLESQQNKKYTKVEYHAWKYQETPASWAYLYELICDKYLGKWEWGNYWHYVCALFKLNWKRVGWFTPLRFLTAIAITITVYCSFALPPSFRLGLSAAFLVGSFALLELLRKEYSTKATDLIKKYTIRHSFKATMGLQADIQDELIKLLKVWIPTEKLKKIDKPSIPHKILLIVEDLDRCYEERIMPNIDALRIMLEDDDIASRLIIITAMDETILKNAICQKYESLKPKNNISGLVTEYLDKVFILSVKLGELSGVQRVEYLRELYKNDIKDRKSQSKIPSSDSVINILVPDNINSNKTNEMEQEVSLLRPVEIQNKAPEFAHLNIMEIALLESVVEHWEKANPRKISIFYYRFLLFKNILIDRFYASSRDIPWKNRDDIEKLLRLILYYHEPDKFESLRADKGKAMKKASEMQKNIIGPTEFNITGDKTDGMILYDVLDMVIAY